MAITEQHTQESLSIAYIQAVCASAGMNLSSTRLDYGVDVTISEVQKLNGRVFDTGYKLDVQLKSSYNWKEKDQEIHYDLNVENYNDMVERDQLSSTPLILVLLCQPKEKDDWLSISSEYLQLKKCCYWHKMNGNRSSNKRTERLYISKKQMFTPKSLKDLFVEIKAGSL